jgi:DNA-binding LacI/PurR family transcriptional regulator
LPTRLRGSADDVWTGDHYVDGQVEVREAFDTIGRRGLEALLSQIEPGRADGRRVVIEPELVVRESTAAPSG